MNKSILLTIALWMGAALCAEDSVKMDHEVSQGTDYELFLNPYLETELKSVSGEMVLDAGCGLALGTIIAAKNGASVCAFQTKRNLLEQAQAAVQKAGVESQVAFNFGDMNKLPYESNFFDRAFCVNAETIVPSTTHIISQDSFQEVGLGAHFKEIARVMKEGGHLLVAAPSSFGVIFSDGSRPQEAVNQHIQQVLSKIGKCEDSAVIIKFLSELEEVMRATFVRSEEGLKLVTNEKELCIGQSIWCKIPGSVISSIYHSEEEYLVALQRAGLTCEEIKRPCFFGNVKYDLWRTSHHECGKSLGEAYISNHPFTIYYVVKRT